MLSCFGCITVCGCRNCVVGQLAYAPPRLPANYPGYRIASQLGSEKVSPQEERRKQMEAEKIQLREHKKLSGLKIMERDIADLDVLYWSSDNELNYQPVVRLMEIHPGEFDAVGGSTNSGKPGWLINFHHYSMLTKKKQVIHIFAYILQDQSHDPFTFLFSHGNATDLGYSWPHAVRLANRLGCNVVMYDYSGYGQSTGKPTEDNTYADIRACYQFCTEKLKVSPHRLILYGQSVGSGPSVDLLCDKNYPVVGAVLHSGLASGLRILGNWQWEPGKSPFFDLYRNVDKLSKLEKQKCIYIMHGMRDVEVPANHGEMLQTTKPDAVWGCWFPQYAEHNDIDFLHLEEYFTRLTMFLNHLRYHDELDDDHEDPFQAPQAKTQLRAAKSVDTKRQMRMYLGGNEEVPPIPAPPSTTV